MKPWSGCMKEKTKRYQKYWNTCMDQVVWYSYQETITVYMSNKCLHITHYFPLFVACFPIPEQYHTFFNLLNCLVCLIVCYVILRHTVRWGGLCVVIGISDVTLSEIIPLIICIWTHSEYSVLCFWEKALQQQFNVNSTGWNKALCY